MNALRSSIINVSLSQLVPRLLHASAFDLRIVFSEKEMPIAQRLNQNLAVSQSHRASQRCCSFNSIETGGMLVRFTRAMCVWGYLCVSTGVFV